MTTTYTPNLGLVLPDFLTAPWHALLNSNTTAIDSIITNALKGNRTAIWANNTGYLVGAVVIDSTDASMYLCKVAHTSPIAPTTFAANRLANPTYWQSLSYGLQAKGQWLNSTQYNVNDYVYDATLNIVAVCKTQHVSSAGPATINTDAANWTYIANFGSLVTTGLVRNDTAQNPSTVAAKQARDNCFAAPRETIPNLSWNGECTSNLATPGQQPSVATNGAINIAHVIDHWVVQHRAAATIAVSAKQDTAVPTNTPYVNSMAIVASPGLTIPAATDFSALYMTLLGYDVAHLGWGTANAQSITVSGFIYTGSGPMCVAVQNGAENRSYIREVVVPGVFQWNYFSVNFPGDTGGVWDKTTGTGMKIKFCVQAGSTMRSAPNQWNADSNTASTNMQNQLVGGGNTVNYAGITVVAGSEAVEQARSFYTARSLHEIMLRTERFYEKSYEKGTLPGAVTSIGANVGKSYVAATANFYMPPVRFRREKNTVPTMTLYSSATGTAGNIRNASAAADLAGTVYAASLSTKGFTAFTSSGATGANDVLESQWVADSRLT